MSPPFVAMYQPRPSWVRNSIERWPSTAAPPSASYF